MKMQRLVMIMMVCVSLTAFALTPVNAAPPCGPYQPQPATTDTNHDPTFCQAAFQNNDLVWVSASVPYAWLRDRPTSNVVVATIQPHSEQFYVDRLYTDQRDLNPVWDGGQWWYYVRDAQNPDIFGWIEQASLEYVNVSTPEPTIIYFPDANTPANWPLPAPAKPTNGLPFIWLRQFPASDSATIATVYPQQPFTILANPAPSWDGAQWWWSVEFTSSGQTYHGWVEQSAIAVY